MLLLRGSSGSDRGGGGHGDRRRERRRPSQWRADVHFEPPAVGRRRWSSSTPGFRRSAPEEEEPLGQGLRRRRRLRRLCRRLRRLCRRLCFPDLRRRGERCEDRVEPYRDRSSPSCQGRRVGEEVGEARGEGERAGECGAVCCCSGEKEEEVSEGSMATTSRAKERKKMKIKQIYLVPLPATPAAARAIIQAEGAASGPPCRRLELSIRRGIEV